MHRTHLLFSPTYRALPALLIGALLAFLVIFTPAGVFSQATPVSVLPLGDSITQGDTVYNSYRRPLWHALQDNGHNVDFIGSLTTNAGGPPPNPDFDLDHEGHASWRADEIAANLAPWLESYTPQIVLLHVGHNDLTRVNRNDVVVQGTLNDVSEIIDILRVDNPNVTVLLAQLIPSCISILDANIVTFNERLPALAAEKSLPESPVIIVDQFTGFDAQTDTHDCVHPNESGEQKMAQRWYDALAPLLGAGGTPLPTATHTPILPTATATMTETPGPTATPSNTPVPATATNTAVPSTPTNTAVPGACGGETILFVGNTNPLPAADQTLADHLIAGGRNVVVLDERSISAADADGKDLIIISDSVGARRVNTIFRDVTVPVMTWEAGLYDDLGMVPASFASLGFLNDQTQITITDSTHPLAAGLSGVVTIVSAPETFFYGFPGEEAMTVAGDSSGVYPMLFAYETGAAMIDMAAPARRLGFVNGAGALYTSAGWQLFDAAVSWLLNCGGTPAATATHTPVPATATNTAVPTETQTPAPPTSTFTPAPPTSTFTPGPTATATSVPPTATVTETAVPPTATAVPGACGGETILFVGRTNPLPAADQALADYLVGLGHTIVVRNELSISSADADGKALVIISDSVSSRRVNTIFRDVTAPVMTWEAGLYDDLGMTAATFASMGFIGEQTAVDLIDATHPLAAGLSGAVTILQTPDNVFWGVPGGDSEVVAMDAGGTYATIFAYEVGSEMVGMTAPARRLAFANGNGLEYTAQGWQLFETAVSWLLACEQ